MTKKNVYRPDWLGVKHQLLIIYSQCAVLWCIPVVKERGCLRLSSFIFRTICVCVCVCACVCACACVRAYARARAILTLFTCVCTCRGEEVGRACRCMCVEFLLRTLWNGILHINVRVHAYVGVELLLRSVFEVRFFVFTLKHYLQDSVCVCVCVRARSVCPCVLLVQMSVYPR